MLSASLRTTTIAVAVAISSVAISATTGVSAPAQEAASLDSLVIQEQRLGVSPATLTHLEATCPVGYVLSGGGYYADGKTPLQSAPVVESPPRRWQVDIQAGGGTPYNLRVYAVCLRLTGVVAGASVSSSLASTVKPDQDDSRRKLTDEQRQQAQRTNRSNRDDEFVEGNVLEIGLDTQGPFAVIGNRDGKAVVRLLCSDQCPTIHVGDYIEADGTKEHEQLFYADEVTVTR